MEHKDINEENSNKIKQFWNDFVTDYEAVAENATLQSSTILYSMTKIKNKQRVCEVGVGCGQAPRMYISQLMPKGAAYFASDISDEMVKTFEKRFDESDSKLNPKVKLQPLELADMHDCEKLIEDAGSDVERKCFITEANNEKLPYPDEFFDCYISNLSLMIVDNHHNQLLEAYRVLQPGGVAGFTVWGRKENTLFFTILPRLLEKLELYQMPKGGKNHFHL